MFGVHGVPQAARPKQIIEKGWWSHSCMVTTTSRNRRSQQVSLSQQRPRQIRMESAGGPCDWMRPLTVCGLKLGLWGLEGVPCRDKKSSSWGMVVWLPFTVGGDTTRQKPLTRKKRYYKILKANPIFIKWVLPINVCSHRRVDDLLFSLVLACV